MPDTPDNLYRFLLARVRSKLHVVLCQSPVGGQFARRAQQFPGLIAGATIDWFLPWPRDALISVASKFVDGLAMACDPQASTHAISIEHAKCGREHSGHIFSHRTASFGKFLT